MSPLAATLLACTPDPSGGAGATSTATSTTTTTSGAGTGGGTAGGGDSTGGAPSCVSDYGNELVTNAAILPMLADPTGLSATLTPTLCPGQTDYFRFDTLCGGYFGVEVIVDEPGDDVSLTLLDESGAALLDPAGTALNSAGPPTVGSGAYRTEVLHRIVPSSESVVVAVEHADGGEIPYQMRTYFLPTGTCLPADWTCPPTVGVLATETACRGEPAGGLCASGDQITTNVALPTAGTGATAFGGWLVTPPADTVRYHANPSAIEQTTLLGLCNAACQAQWSDNPDVAATCSAGFVAPAEYAVPSEPAVALIPPAMQDGSGLFTAPVPGPQQLSCNLHDTCCLEFDESLCIASPSRVTSGRFPLGVGEEYVVDLVTSESSVVTGAEGVFDSAPLSGEAGFSLCTEGNVGEPCPFYLGHFFVENNDNLDVPVTCPDGTMQTLQLEDLEISLAQPAFGISNQDTDDVAFPPGALVFEGSFLGNSVPYTIRGPNTDPVFIRASATTFEATKVTLTGHVPCGSGTTLATGLFTLEVSAARGATPAARPPLATITTPSSVSCGGTVSLTATTSDPDGDLADERWYVDEVLIAPTVSSIKITQSHTLRVLVTDARGAATTATKSIGCT